jgi:SAM-dependent methyltransferase
MNQAHMEFCTSAAWKQILEEMILPGALRSVELGREIVEIGPGPGFTTEVLLRSGGHVTAVEIDPVLASELRERLAGALVEVLVGDACDTGLECASYSGAASFHMLHHVPTAEAQDRIFAELARIVRPGGTVLLADGFDGEEVRRFHEGDDYNPIDITGLPDRLTRFGLSGVHIESHDLGWYCIAAVV